MKNVFYILANSYFDLDPYKAINYYHKSYEFHLISINNDQENYKKEINDQYFSILKQKDNAQSYYIAYNLCCAYLRENNSMIPEDLRINNAFNWLETAINDGYPNKKWLYNDPDIKLLRDKYKDRFLKIINKVK